MSTDDNFSQLCIQLKDSGVIKFGKFTLKSGLTSSIYIDLRSIISFPDLLMNISQQMAKTLTDVTAIHYDRIVGVPYAALPMGTLVAQILKKGLIIKRKEAKSYGTKKVIEGDYHKNENCVIIEDVTTTGGSIVEVAQALRQEGLIVTHAIVCIDREQGAKDNLNEHGIQLLPVFTVSSILKNLSDYDEMYKEYFNDWKQFISNNQTSIKMEPSKPRVIHPLVQKIRDSIEKKESNLCLAVDVNNSADLLQWAERCGPHICILKTHIDIIPDFTSQTAIELRKLADKHGFFLFEDRKLADIGNVVRSQASPFVNWCNLVTVHCIPGVSVLQGVEAAIKSIGSNKSNDVGVLLVAEMSSQNSYRSDDYKQLALEMATAYEHLVIGFISQTRFSNENTTNFLFCTPGVKLVGDGDDLGQCYRTPEQAIECDGCDIVIVGRGITQSENWLDAIVKHKQEAFIAFKKRATSTSSGI